MSMEINQAYNNYAAAASGASGADKAKTDGKTTAENKAYRNVAEYTKALQDRFNYMNTGTTSMQGVPTTVSVSGAFLRKCMNDPEKAKYLEENLAAIPDCVKSLVNYTKTMPGSPVCTYATYMIGDDGNITCMSGCTNDPDGKIARENAEKKAREKKAQEEKWAEKKAQEEDASKRRAEKSAARKVQAEKLSESRKRDAETFTRTAVGMDVKTVTQSIIRTFSGVSASAVASFDVKS